MLRDGEPFVFRTFPVDVPAFLRTWRPGPARAVWDRHYLVAPGHGLRLAGGERVEVTRLVTDDGFRVEEAVLTATFPLDWMALTCVANVLPSSFRTVDIDGRTPQAFVDSLATPSLPQASVLVQETSSFLGSVIGRVQRLTVPDWNTRMLSVAYESPNGTALRSLLAGAGLRGVQHRDLCDELREAHRIATTPPTPVRPARPRSAA
ncbi:hypothetical protein [Acuticoccus mangrovi]|uniref:Uncharacterized protein n=1 Tax=Acuticoccus mangrovi TaxID=2796142 RepID=A0A934ITB2_9HYPH|nr:hypothetical protein [Acuticoccus mangrovi]MBJ3778238.1 hypothetical protein [Acuticoccus mangrovi]